MQQKSAVSKPPSPRVATIPKPLLAASVLTAALAVGSALLYGLATGPSLERQRAEEIDRENGEVCAALGITSAAGRSTCAEGLSRVRRLHAERLSCDSIL